MRWLSIGNGELEVNYDSHGQIVCFYYPYVGQENQTSGNTNKVGFCHSGKFRWIDSLECSMEYMDDLMIGRVRVGFEPFEIVFTDFVDDREPLFTRIISIRNYSNVKSEIRVFMHQNFSLFDNDVGDTGVYDPEHHAVVHYKGLRCVLAKLVDESGRWFDQYAVGKKTADAEGNIIRGTYLDAEDCALSGNPVEQGFVDSVISISVDVEPNSTAKLYYWLLAGKRIDKVTSRAKDLVPSKAESDFSFIRSYWSKWLSRVGQPDISPKVLGLYRKSLTVISSQCGRNGSIVASTDYSIERLSHDTYNYVWPRDAAYVANAMDMAGYPEYSLRLFDFASKVLERDGYLLQKYNSNGTLASSWHPWVSNYEGYLPIQEDETALLVWCLCEHYFKYGDIERIAHYYHTLVKPASAFLMRFMDKGLPRPSYDLWEERFGIHIHTVAAVHAALKLVSRLAKEFGDAEHALQCSDAAETLSKSVLERMVYGGRFVRRLYFEDGQLKPDLTVDSAMLAPILLGMVDIQSPVGKNSAEAVLSNLTTKMGGLARYEGDWYMRTTQDGPGNPWVITTLWAAQYKILCGAQRDRAEAMRLIEWCCDHAPSTGVLPEQFDLATGQPTSVAPLTWSHAEFVRTVQFYLGNSLACLNQD
ncbi:MAG: glycoside hydrolase family 15 protein [Thermoprotei archaeon]